MLRLFAIFTSECIHVAKESSCLSCISSQNTPELKFETTANKSIVCIPPDAMLLYVERAPNHYTSFDKTFNLRRRRRERHYNILTRISTSRLSMSSHETAVIPFLLTIATSTMFATALLTHLCTTLQFIQTVPAVLTTKACISPTI